MRPAGHIFVVEAVGEVSEEEENLRIYEKDRLDEVHDDKGIWAMDEHMNFALDGEGNLDDTELDANNPVQDENENIEGGDGTELGVWNWAGGKDEVG